MKRNKQVRKVSIFLISLIVFATFSADQVAYANFEGYLYGCTPGENDSETDEGDVSTNTASGQAGSWTEEGTKANEIAMDMWEYWKNKGFGGPAISGVMGNVAHEGGFDIPDRAEGHYGNDQKSNGISEGNIPFFMDHYPVGNSGEREGGAGHYQFTPYSKYAPAGDEKWNSTENQSDYVWSSEVQKASWLKDYIDLSSVDEAVSMWFSKYERGMALDPAKTKSGKKAYEVFGGSNITADSALANAVGTANQGEGEEEERSSNIDNCGLGKGSTLGSGSGGDLGEVGEIATSLLGYFSYLMLHGEAHIGSVDNPDKGGVTDCSGFIWLVLAKAGFKIPDDMGWYTKSMEDDATGKQEYLEEISADEASAGDIVIVTTSGDGIGHTAILMEDWKKESDADNATEIIQMGGASMDGVNTDRFKNSFKSLVTDVYGDHTTTFARAIKE